MKRLGTIFMTSESRAKFLRFIATGVLNTAFGYGLYALFVMLGTHAQIALAAQFSICVLCNYVLHARFVFNHDGRSKLLRYILVYVGVYLGNAFGLNLLLGLGISPLIAQLSLLPLVVVLTFLMLTHIFRETSSIVEVRG